MAVQPKPNWPPEMKARGDPRVAASGFSPAGGSSAPRAGPGQAPRATIRIVATNIVIAPGRRGWVMRHPSLIRWLELLFSADAREASSGPENHDRRHVAGHRGLRLAGPGCTG